MPSSNESGTKAEGTQKEKDAATLRRRADLGRRSAFATNFYALPAPVQNALYGIAGELEEIADRLEADA